MGKKVTDELVLSVRSVLGEEFSDMDIIRALHMANNDVTAAINIIFDTPRNSSRPTATPRTKSTIDASSTPSPPQRSPAVVASPEFSLSVNQNSHKKATTETIGIGENKDSDDDDDDDDAVVVISEKEVKSSSFVCSDWWFVGSAELAGLSTCKGRRLKAGDEVMFSFPSEKHQSSPKLAGRGRSAASSEIVRFSTKESGEIGRIPNEWARCLLPLVKAKKVRIEGSCKNCPDVLGIMDTIVLSVSVYINRSMFLKHHQTSLKTVHHSSEEAIVHPLPSLFKLLGLTPFKKAEFTPEDLYTRKRPLNSKDSSGVHVPMLPLEKCQRTYHDDAKSETAESSISDSDLDNIVGIADGSELQEMEPPSTLQCDLRPYQKQALHWMVQLEKGRCLEGAATTLHPCWDAYRLADKRQLEVYLNAFSGDATTEFPSTLQMARGGILADAMGLGKTIMTIALLLAHSDRGGSGAHSMTESSISTNEIRGNADQSMNPSKKITSISCFNKLMKSRTARIGGGCLIVCPMTLIGQWKAEIETHAQPGSLSVYVHYGQSRLKEAKLLAQNDIVLTTYGVLASEFSAENAEENGGLYSVRWFRVVLDEAHTIKSLKSQISLAAAALTADRRWCLTGTPIQNNLEDIYSLLRFLRLEPWGNWGLWQKLIQKPFEEGDERSLKILQSILRPIMLRRTKSSTDKEGRPIIVLPPMDVQVIYCEHTEAEKDFYEALFKRSKVKFDQFVEQGRVLHNYASILELLLRLRQCCDHPFLVMSRGDTQEFSDFNKLAKRFLRGGQDAELGESNNTPSKAYIQAVVEEMRRGEKGECPICLEVFEDAVLTPCAHQLCRECLLASWRNAMSGLCPVCRKTISRQDLITAPTESRFQIDIEKNWVESSKVSALLQELENLRSTGSKSIVFSQWTAFLDLLQIPLSRNNISFLRLDGTLNLQQREKVIKEFTEESEIAVLLMSLKAGGVGINLTAASNAFIMSRSSVYPMEGRGRRNGRGRGRGRGGNAPDITQLAETVQHQSESVNRLLQERDHQRHGRRRNGSDESSDSGNSYNWSDSDSGSSSKSARRHHYRRQSDAGIKVDLPEFSGNLSPEEFLDWLSAIEKFFEWKDLSDSKRVKLVATRLRGLASTWWDQVQEARMRKGKDKIRSWSKMKAKMREQFLPANYSQSIYQQFHKLQQGARSVREYTEEFHRLSLRTDLSETKDQQVARYLVGLRIQLQDDLSLFHLPRVEDAYQAALKAEAKQQRSTSWKSNMRMPSHLKESSTSKGIAGTMKNNKGRDVGPSHHSQEKLNKQAGTRCFKCNEIGHWIAECPLKQRQVHMAEVEAETEDEEDAKEAIYDEDNEADEVAADQGEFLLVHRVLTSPKATQDDSWLRTNIFRTRCTCYGRVCNIIIDGGSCENMVSKEAVEKLKLKEIKHPQPYKIGWFKRGVEDPWWNPAVEEQAVMRIHRIGQSKKVSIKRFIIKGTVEERMEAVQARKQRLISGALTDQEVRSARIEELKLLFT